MKHLACKGNSLQEIKTAYVQAKNIVARETPAYKGNSLPSMKTPCSQAKHLAGKENNLPVRKTAWC